ncbi:hypothetical protein V1503_19145 [Bacillus sp. SCS-151]|uniref:hypothetical protein n=1 Tax=Nanhaiella sioensis TaxID=3115293 RepID=UPI00397C9B58
MKNIKLKTVATSTILGITLFASSAGAWNFGSDESRGWLPYKGSGSAYKENGNVLVDLSFYYTSSQVSYISDPKRGYPTIDVRDDDEGAFDGIGISTTLPDPKYDYEDDNKDGYNEELEVVSLDKKGFVAEKKYYVAQEWDVNTSSVNDNSALIAYAATSIQLLPSLDYNAFDSAFIWSTRYSNVINNVAFSPMDFTALTSEKAVNISAASQLNDKFLSDYSDIKTRKDLDEYKNKSHLKVKGLKNKEEYSFLVTLNQPTSIDDFFSLTDKNNIEVTEVLARGIDENKDKVTISTTKAEYEVLQNFQEKDAYEFKGIIEIKGVSTGKDIKELLKDSNIYAIEIENENEDQKAFGLYWKHEQF